MTLADVLGFAAFVFVFVVIAALCVMAGLLWLVGRLFEAFDDPEEARGRGSFLRPFLYPRPAGTAKALPRRLQGRFRNLTTATRGTWRPRQ